MEVVELPEQASCALDQRWSRKSLSFSRQLKNGVRALLESRSLKFLRDYYSGIVSCLLYHRLCPPKYKPNEFSPYSGLSVTVESFDAQMRYLKKNFDCISLPRALELLAQGRLSRRSIVITFDDGYKDNLTLALPILEKYELPATLYVTDGLVDRSAELWWFEQEFIIRHCNYLDFETDNKVQQWSLNRPEEKFEAIANLNKVFKTSAPSQQKSIMQVLRAQCPRSYSYDSEILTWEEVQQLDRHPLITIGAHTTNHSVLSQLTQSELLNELRGSKQRIESKLGHSVPHLAYPFGGRHEVGLREYQAARESGFDSAVTTLHGHLYEKHQHFAHTLPRISINYDDSLAAVVWKLNGIYSMLRHGGKRVVLG